MGVRKIYARTVIDGLGRSPEFRSELANGMGHIKTPEFRRTQMRTAILELIGPLPHDAGPITEVHVRLLEAALRAIDCPRVEADLTA